MHAYMHTCMHAYIHTLITLITLHYITLHFFTSPCRVISYHEKGTCNNARASLHYIKAWGKQGMTLKLAMDLTKIVALFFSRALMAELVECQLVFVSCSQDCEMKNELPGPVHTNIYIYIHTCFFSDFRFLF